MIGRWQTLVITVAVALVFDSHAAYSADADISVPTTIIPDNIIVDNLDYLRFNWTLASNDTKVKATQPPIKYAVYNILLHADKKKDSKDSKDRARQSFISEFQQRKQCKSIFTVQQSVADSLGHFVRGQLDKVFNTWAMIDPPYFESKAAVYLIKVNGTNNQGVTASSEVFVVDVIDSLVPVPVSQLAVVAVNASKVRVRWRHTLARKNIIFYSTVTCIDDSQHCAAIPASSRHQELAINSTDFVLENTLVNVIIGNLHPFTRYQIEVRCRLLGIRCDSHLSSVNTTHFMTSSAPSSVLPELHSAGFALPQGPQTGLIVYWKAVPKWYLMDNLMHYRVCVTSSQGPVQCDITPPTVISTVLPHANPTLGPVRVTVDAVTSAGVQTGLNQTRSYIDISPTSRQLLHVMVVSIVNDTAVDVMWASETSSPPPIYTVFWCRRLHHSGLCQSDISWLDVPGSTTGPVTVSLGGEYMHFSVGMSVSLQHTHTGILWARCFHDVNNNYELQQPSVSVKQTTHSSVRLVITPSLCHQMAAGTVTGIEREYVVTHCLGHHSNGCPADAVLATVTKSMTLPDVHVEVGGLEADENYSVFVRGVSAHSHSPSVFIPIHTENTPLSNPALIFFLVLWVVIIPIATVVGVSIFCYWKFTRQLDIQEPTSNSPSDSGSSSEPLLYYRPQAPVSVRVDSDSSAPRHHSSQQDLKVAAELVTHDRLRKTNSYSKVQVLASDDEDDESIDSRASLAPSDEKCKESTVLKITECTVAESQNLHPPACTVDVDMDLKRVGVCAPCQQPHIGAHDHVEGSQFSDSDSDSGSLLVHKLPTSKVSAALSCCDAIVMPAFAQVDASNSSCNGIGTISNDKHFTSGHSISTYSQLDLSNVLTTVCNSGSSADGSSDIDSGVSVIVDDKTTGDFSEKDKVNDITVDDKANDVIVAHKTSDVSVKNNAANDVNVLDKVVCNVVVEDQANDVKSEENDNNDSVGDIIYCRGIVTGPNLA